MRRVMFIAYDFPPGIGIGGGLRSARFAEYLPEFSWQPTVLSLDGGQVPASDVVRLASPTPWQYPYQLTPYGWAYALRRYLRSCRDEFDLVYVSCPPYPYALVAAIYAQRKNLPLVVDFRDAWSLNPYQEGSRLNRLFYRYLVPSLEKRLLSGADLLILNTRSALRAYRTLFPQAVHKMRWLPNGYDERAFPRNMQQPESGEFVMLHAGRFGIGGRSPGNILAGLRLARDVGCDVRLVVLGEQSESVREQIIAAEIGANVELRGQIDYTHAVREMCAAAVLVLVQAPSSVQVQAVAGKTFDYLQAGRPILAIGPAGDNIDLVRKHACHFENPNDEPEAIAQAIIRLRQDWAQGGHKKNKVDPLFSQRYERRALTAELATHFDRLLGLPASSNR